jgi:hypothetical protein
MNKFAVEKYEGLGMTRSEWFDTREEASAYRDSCGVPAHNTMVVEVDERGRAVPK